MAKDGTNRGGARPGAGRPRKALADKIASGNPGGRALTQIKVPDNLPDLIGEDMPQPSEILSAQQKNGKPLGADKIYRDTWLWLKGFKCERLVSPALLQDGFSVKKPSALTAFLVNIQRFRILRFKARLLQ